MRGRKIHFFCDGAAKPVVAQESGGGKAAVFSVMVKDKA